MDIIKKTDSSSYRGVQTLEILEWAKNYNSWIAAQIRPYVHGKTMEFGAGTGNISLELLPACETLYLTDVNRALVTQLKHRFSSNQNVKVFNLDVSTSIPKKYYRMFHVIVGINVLEHIQHDGQALKNIRRMLQPNGILALLVPAKQFAYSHLDLQLGHYRRYEKDDLRNKLVQAGFTVKKIYFFNFAGLFTWIIRDKIDNNATALRKHHIWLFERLVSVLSFLETYISIPIGISLIAICQQ